MTHRHTYNVCVCHTCITMYRRIHTIDSHKVRHLSHKLDTALHSVLVDCTANKCVMLLILV